MDAVIRRKMKNENLQSTQLSTGTLLLSNPKLKRTGASTTKDVIAKRVDVKRNIVSVSRAESSAQNFVLVKGASIALKRKNQKMTMR